MFIKWYWTLFMAIIMNLVLFYNMNNTMLMFYLYNTPKMELTLVKDDMSALFTTIVIIISMLISGYSVDYMANEKKTNYFYSMMILFISSMVILTLSPNIMMMMIGWDGLGLTSFCLVIFFQNYSSMNSGLITFMTNRLGDGVMVMAISLTMLNMSTKKNSKTIMLTSFMITAGAMTKSAQIPFSAWLPAAMSAPTPVSSLVHSSTLVTAGVYLLSRFNTIFDFKLIKTVVLSSALTTSMLAGIFACKETDGKKIVAMSTLSQLGVMAFNLAMNSWKLCLFHMSIHALFKALLFMNTGFNMNMTFGGQEKRNMSLSKTASKPMMQLSNMSLMGVPFMSGFYSKDSILECMNTKEMNWFSNCAFTMMCILTSVYTLKLMKILHETPKVKGSTEENFVYKNMKKASTTLSSVTIMSMNTIMSEINMPVSKPNFSTKKMGMLYIMLAAFVSTTNMKSSYNTNSQMIQISTLTNKMASAYNQNSNLNKKDNSQILLSNTSFFIIKATNMFSNKASYFNKTSMVWFTMMVSISFVVLTS